MIPGLIWNCYVLGFRSWVTNPQKRVGLLSIVTSTVYDPSKLFITENTVEYGVLSR